MLPVRRATTGPRQSAHPCVLSIEDIALIVCSQCRVSLMNNC